MDITLQRLTNLDASERDKLKRLRNFLLDIKKGRTEVLALKDLAVDYLARILAFESLGKAESLTELKRWGIDGDLVQNTLNTLLVLTEKLNLDDKLVEDGIKIVIRLNKFKPSLSN